MNNPVIKVIRFEILRNLKKPSFWIAAILIPIGLIGYIAIAGFAGYNAEANLSQSNTDDLRLAYCDDANYLETTSFINNSQTEQSLTQFLTREEGLNALKAGKIDVFYYLPKDFSTQRQLEIHSRTDNLNVMSDYSQPIKTLLQTTAQKHIAELDYSIVSGQIQFEKTTYSTEDNHILSPSQIFSKASMPIITLALFYIILVMLGNRLTVAMVEEKENRISELLLTSIKPIHLIIGKTVSMMILGLIQITILLIPLLIMYLVATHYHLIDLGFTLTITPLDFTKNLALLIAAFYLFTAFAILIGTISSTAKDAANYAGFLMLSMMLPLIFIGSFGQINAASYVLTYFPPATPISTMLRSLLDNLPVWEYFIALFEMLIVGTLVLKLAAYIFCHNAISFTAKISLKQLLGAPRKQWKK